MNDDDTYDKWYAGNNAYNLLVSPFFTTDEQLKTMPAAKIIIGEFDGLRILTQSFAERLMQINPKAEFSVYNGLVHAFLVTFSKKNIKIFLLALLASIVVFIIGIIIAKLFLEKSSNDKLEQF